MNNKKYGLIDIGSNTIRLVIFEVNSFQEMHQLQNVKVTARLSQYLSDEKILAPAGINLLIETLKSFKIILGEYGVTEFYPIATAAIRQAKNNQAILEQVYQETNLHLDILSEKEEATYGQYAITHTTKAMSGFTIDIGGGSTEITYFKDKTPVHFISLPFGAVTLKNMFFTDKAHNNEKAIRKTEAFLQKQFQQVDWLNQANLPLIAIGGGARNIVNVHQQMTNYPIAGNHEYKMSKSHLKDVLALFESLSFQELQTLDGLSRDRADIILVANLVFLQLFKVLDASEFIFCNKGLREGFLIQKINAAYQEPYSIDAIPAESVLRLAQSYGVSSSVARQRVTVTKDVAALLTENDFFPPNPHWAKLLFFSAQLYYLGQYVESEAASQHTFYLISNSNLNGFTHRERVAVALLASYKNKSLLKQYLNNFSNWFSAEEIKWLQSAGGLIKFSDTLTASHINQIHQITFQQDAKNEYTLTVYYTGDILIEAYRANRQKKHLESLIDGSINIIFTKN
ncbi:MAG: Ppx/GppA family phosphatase [Enterococcus sp.]